MKLFACVGALVVCLFAGHAVHAQSFAAFDFKSQSALSVPAFSNAEIKQLIATLDRLLGPVPKTKPSPGASAANAESDASVAWQFARRLQAGRLSAAQENRVLTHLDTLARTRPGGEDAFAGPRRMIRDLSIGKVAPPIAGLDLDGHPFDLSDYRGKVVVLLFSADWCAICRAQAPYERFLLDRYGNWPFAILSVQTGSNRDAARTAHANAPLASRAWWDAPRPGDPHGPIAGAWNVVGWPATYVIDGDGVIRFVDVRDEDLLRAVRQLVEAHVERDTAVRRK